MRLASNSEYTVMRASGLSPRAPACARKDRHPFVVLTFVIGEWVAPVRGAGAEGEDARHELDDRPGPCIGLWFKDEGSFINVREARQTNLLGVRIYDFDADYRLQRITLAQRADYAGKGNWRCRSHAHAFHDRGSAHRAQPSSNGARA